MTPEILAVLAILVGAVALLASERLRPDLVGLLVLALLAITGLVSPEQAVAGFASPAVVTVWAMFMLSAGLVHSGVAHSIGRAILRLAGHSEVVLMVAIMVAEAMLSAFVNNVAAMALLLPAVVDVCRQTRRPVGRYLIPLAMAAQLGGTLTQIGTPPNILIATFTREQGLARPFGMFTFTPAAAVCLAVGIGFAVTFGRRVLPHFAPGVETAGLTTAELARLYDLPGRMEVLRIPAGSALAGMSLGASRLGAALGVQVMAVVRGGHSELAPGPHFVLASGDKLVVEGRLDRLAELRGAPDLVVTGSLTDLPPAVLDQLAAATLRIAQESALVGTSLAAAEFRRRYQVSVVGVVHHERPVTGDLRDVVLRAGDQLIVIGPQEAIGRLAGETDFCEFRRDASGRGILEHPHRRHLVTASIPPGSALAGRTLADSRLGDAFDINVAAIVRSGSTIAAPSADQVLLAEDLLLIAGGERSLRVLDGLQTLEVDPEPSPTVDTLESENVALAEAVLSPHTTLIGRTLRDIRFRERYGLNAIALWREGRSYRSNLREMALRFGDALLLHGPRERIELLATEPDFLVLTQRLQPVPRRRLAPWAVGILAAVIGAAISGLLPIAIAGILGAIAMVLVGCLTMEEAYRGVEWPVVFLIASTLPLGVALQDTGAASLIGNVVADAAGRAGARAALAAIYLLGAAAVQFVPNPAVAVLLAPVGLSAALRLGVAPEAFLMAVALAASAGFASPTGHAVNLMVMGPGGYRFRDYGRFGLPLIGLLFLVVVLLLPLLFPLQMPATP